MSAEVPGREVNCCREESAAVPVLVARTVGKAAAAQRLEGAGDASSCLEPAAGVCDTPQPASAAGEGATMRALQLPAEHAVDTLVGVTGMLSPAHLIACAPLNLPSELVKGSQERDEGAES